MAGNNEGAGWVTEDDLVPQSKWKAKAYSRNKNIALRKDDFATEEAYTTFRLSLQNAFLGMGEDGLDGPSWVEGAGRLTPRARQVLTGKAPDPYADFEEFVVEVGQALQPGAEQVDREVAVTKALNRRGYR